jgi:hypothetical protein
MKRGSSVDETVVLMMTKEALERSKQERSMAVKDL